jgi:hypothetical protein
VYGNFPKRNHPVSRNMDAKALAKRVANAQRAVNRLQAELTAMQEETGFEEPLLTEAELAQVARAHEVCAAANRVYDIITAGLVIKEADWLSEQCVLLAAAAAGLDQPTAQEALKTLKRTGCLYERGGPATVAPLRIRQDSRAG